ncbi:MAG: hypothetical protein ACHQ1D_01675 [Nitrososphaerales archaeon]
MTAEDKIKAILEYLTDCIQDKRVTLREERPPIDTPAHGWYMGYFDSCREAESFIKELTRDCLS